MSQCSAGNLVLVGKVIRPHGRRGLLRIWSYAESENSFLDGGGVFLKSISGKIEQRAVISVKPHKNLFLMELEGLKSKDDAEGYRGAEIFLNKETLSREQDEYFFYDLIGLEVYLDTGQYLGRISQVISTKSNDTYVVKNGHEEILVPAIYEVVKEINLDKGKMIISSVEGFLDLNEV